MANFLFVMILSSFCLRISSRDDATEEKCLRCFKLGAFRNYCASSDQCWESGPASSLDCADNALYRFDSHCGCLSKKKNSCTTCLEKLSCGWNRDKNMCMANFNNHDLISSSSKCPVHDHPSITNTAIILACVLPVVGCFVCVGSICWCCRRKKRKNWRANGSSPYQYGQSIQPYQNSHGDNYPQPGVQLQHPQQITSSFPQQNMCNPHVVSYSQPARGLIQQPQQITNDPYNRPNVAIYPQPYADQQQNDFMPGDLYPQNEPASINPYVEGNMTQYGEGNMNQHPMVVQPATAPIYDEGNSMNTQTAYDNSKYYG
jgi:hypothetical protein